MFITNQNNFYVLFALLNDFEVATQCNMAALTSYAARAQKSICTHSLAGGQKLIFNAIFH